MPEDQKAKPEPNSLDDFCDRFNALMQEAFGYGISSVVALAEHDMLSRQNTKVWAFQGSDVGAVGLLEWAKLRLLERWEDDDE